MKVSTLLGSVVLLLVALLVALMGALAVYPEWMTENIGITPEQNRTLRYAIGVLIGLIIGIGWITERLFRRFGHSSMRINWRKKNATADSSTSQEDDELSPARLLTDLTPHLRRRYGRLWWRKVCVLLVMGNEGDVEKVIPGLSATQWREGDGVILVWGGDAATTPDSELMMALRKLRYRAVNGLVWVVSQNTLAQPTTVDAVTRQMQVRSRQLGWKVPLYVWNLCKSDWDQSDRPTQPVGCLLEPGCSVETVAGQLQGLTGDLTQIGMKQTLDNWRHDFLLRLSQTLQQGADHKLAQSLHPLLGAMQPVPLAGVMFSLPLPATNQITAHGWLADPSWQGVLDSARQFRPARAGFPRERALLWSILGLALFWGAGSVLSFISNRAQIRETAQLINQASDAKRPIVERLTSLKSLQEKMGQLQYRAAARPPLSSRFGLSQNDALLPRAWPGYQRSYNALMRDESAALLISQLTELVNLPPETSQRLQRGPAAYRQLKAYLMMTHPQKSDVAFLRQVIMETWPQRQDVPAGMWKNLAPSLISFYAQNLPAHPDWKITPDSQLVNQVRQVLLRQYDMRNAEATIYQKLLKQIAQSYADLPLSQMVGDTDYNALFSTKEIVPGMFTRRAWEQQVKKAIEKIANSRREEIDWVLSDSTQPVNAELSPEALQARLTERYFTDFANSWLNFLNSLQWHKAGTLSDTIDQLTLMADVRQSPVIALMNTVAFQGRTGEQKKAISDSIVASAQNLLNSDRAPAISQSAPPQGPMNITFDPLLALLAGENSDGGTSLSLQTYLTRITRVRLKLQQIASAPDPQAMMQTLAQTVFQGKAVDFTDTRDYGNLLSASLGEAWSGFGQALLVTPMEQAWQQVLTPTAQSLNHRWQQAIVDNWNSAFTGRYPFAATPNDASLPLLGQYIRSDSGRIEQFLQAQLTGVLYKEGNRWVPDAMNTQGLSFNPQFLKAVNQLSALSEVIFANGDAGVRFEVMARPFRDVLRTNLTLDGQHIEYFNQREAWQSMAWPGNVFKPSASLKWSSTQANTRLLAHYEGSWATIRLLERATVTQLDESRFLLDWKTPDGLTLNYILRTQLGEGPLALLSLRDFKLPRQIFQQEKASEPPDTVQTDDFDDYSLASMEGDE